MSRFDQVDYSRLPFPDAIETWTHQAILDARMQIYLAEWEAAREIDPSLPAYDVQMMETDPAKRLQRIDAYREGLIRQRINEAVRATYLSKADQWNDVVARAAEYLTTPAAGETIDSLRQRAQLAWENLSIGGSYGGYQYQALSVAPVDIADVAVWGYEVHEASLFGVKAIADFPKGEVRIGLLGAARGGLTPPSIIAAVQARLSDRAVRKVNDKINVVQATIAPYTLDARLVLKRGVSAASAADVVAAGKLRASAYAAAVRVQGVRATRGGFEAALMGADPALVADVELFSPAASVGGGPFEAPVMTGLAVDWTAAP